MNQLSQLANQGSALADKELVHQNYCTNLGQLTNQESALADKDFGPN